MKCRYLPLFVFLFLATGIFGCDLFQTREPQPPSQNSSTHEPPGSADAVLRNFGSAIREYNVVNYMGCFADTSFRQYVFVPSTFSSAFVQWSLESERQYFLNLGSPPPTTSPVLNMAIVDSNLSSDTARYTINYFLFYPHRRTDVSQIVQGNMRLYLGRNTQGFWYLYRWEDSRTTTDSTWSYLKANI